MRITYKIFGDLVDGTYLAHRHRPRAHEHAGDADVGAPHGRSSRARHVHAAGRLELEAGDAALSDADPWTFTAPNLQYLFDSPTELSAYRLREFTVTNPDGKTFTIRAAVHTDEPGPRTSTSTPPASRRSSRNRVAVFGEYPGVRHRHLHVPRRLPAVERRRRHGAPQQHRRQRPRQRAQRARHGVARVLPRLERRAHPAAGARAVQLRGGEPDRLAVGRRRVHAVLRLADHGPRRAVRRQAHRRRHGQPGRRRHQRLGPAVPLAGGDEPHGAVHRRGARGRSDELQHHVHFVLHLRRRRSRWGSTCRCATRRTGR